MFGAVCTVHASGEGDDWRAHGDNPQFAEAVANARLIAAAPELLEAGSALIREFDNIYDVDDGRANIPGDLMALVDKLRAVVAKAEGK
ncbi:hypothetical protein [Devosia sp. DBB001]|nr:hypothetical protein [Devosia sp. DBB001]